MAGIIVALRLVKRQIRVCAALSGIAVALAGTGPLRGRARRDDRSGARGADDRDLRRAAGLAHRHRLRGRRSWRPARCIGRTTPGRTLRVLRLRGSPLPHGEDPQCARHARRTMAGPRADADHRLGRRPQPRRSAPIRSPNFASPPLKRNGVQAFIARTMGRSGFTGRRRCTGGPLPALSRRTPTGPYEGSLYFTADPPLLGVTHTQHLGRRGPPGRRASGAQHRGSVRRATLAPGAESAAAAKGSDEAASRAVGIHPLGPLAVGPVGIPAPAN